MRPFLFNMQFPADSIGNDPASPPEQPPAFHMGGFTEEDLEAVRDRAFKQGLEVGARDGFERGQQALRQSVEAQQTQALAAVEAALNSAGSRLDALCTKLEQDTVRVVTALVGRLAPPLLDAVAEAELDNLLAEVLAAAVGQPVLDLRLAPPAAERLRPQMDDLAAKAGFRGKINIIADATQPAGAARADWGSGGAEHSPRSLERQLGDAVAIAISRLTITRP
jgi:flagellar assembly protein FliH